MMLAAVGVLASVMAYRIASPNGQRRDKIVFALLVAAHLAALAVYLLYLRSGASSDATLYYNDPRGVVDRIPTVPGTAIILKGVQWLRQVSGGTFLEVTLLFQSFGILGLAVIARIYHETADVVGRSTPLLLSAFLFLPGLHFWTVPIGKDGIVFAGVSIAIWAMRKPRPRTAALIAAIGIITIARPHIGAVCIMALLIQLALFRGRRWLLVVGIAFPILLLLVVQAFAFTAVPLADFGAALDYISGKFERMSSNQANLGDLGFPLRLISILYRPLFFDTSGLFGLVVSFENLILVGLSLYVLSCWRKLAALTKSEPQVAFALIFGAVVVGAITLSVYNQGAAVRQKMMAMPMLLTLVAWAYLDRKGALATTCHPEA